MFRQARAVGRRSLLAAAGPWALRAGGAEGWSRVTPARATARRSDAASVERALTPVLPPTATPPGNWQRPTVRLSSVRLRSSLGASLTSAGGERTTAMLISVDRRCGGDDTAASGGCHTHAHGSGPVARLRFLTIFGHFSVLSRAPDVVLYSEVEPPADGLNAAPPFGVVALQRPAGRRWREGTSDEDQSDT